jgi:Cytochrome P460/Haem-binding domain
LKLAAKFAIAFVAVFAVLQFVHPGIPPHPPAAEIQVPPQIHQILQNDCYSCHSDQPHLAWFDQIEPGYWLVRKDILAARQHLDFSALGSEPASAQKSALYEGVNMIQLGAMPLPQFLAVHPEARVSASDLAAFKAYLTPWTSLPPAAPALATTFASGAFVAPTPLQSVSPEFNGLAFDPSFENWKPISFTDRGDNNTSRFILGNDVAIRAVESGQISPWPDGARLAKIAWKQETGSDGLIYPGDFVQVELMIKDAKKYAGSGGWGWGRWRGFDLKPYGANAQFVDECTTCHLPVKGDDFVYTLPITTAHSPILEDVNNRAAALPASLPWQPLRWTPITLFVDRQARTMSTLFGNPLAVNSLSGAHGLGAGELEPVYPPGAVLALVTWAQRDDPHWFGARIPDTPVSVEFLIVGSQKPASYRRFDGRGLSESHPSPASIAKRSSFLLALEPAPLP